MMRVILFLATNLGVLLVFNVVASLFGLPQMLSESGQNMTTLLVFAAVFGMGGAFVSLAISKWMAKKSMRVQVIEQPSSSTERWLVDTVKRQADAAGIGMPEVGIFPSQQMNAFATGMNRNNALVAVSAGLLHNMNADEVEAVLGHEIAHVANGDMVTMGLLQGVLNTFVIFIARLAAHAIAFGRGGDSRDGGSYMMYMAVAFVAEMVLGIVASIIVAWFSRWREYRADAGGARLAGNQKMISALRRLQGGHEAEDLPGEFAAFGINTVGNGLMNLLRSHPPLEQRIARLQQSSAAVQ